MKVIRFGSILISIQNLEDQGAFPNKTHEVFERDPDKDIVLRITPDDRIGYEYAERTTVIPHEL